MVNYDACEGASFPNSSESLNLGNSKESTPRGGGFRDRPLKEAKFLLIVLFAPLILFLILHVAPNLVFIQTNGTDAVAAAPEMIAPVRLALQRRIALENLYRRLTLQYAHNFRN